MSGSACFYGILFKVLVKTLFYIVMDVKTIGRLDLKKVPKHKHCCAERLNPAKTPSEMQTKATFLDCVRD